MDFLKRFGKMLTASGPSTSSDSGLYYYIRCHRCGEVIKVRVNPMNDLSHNDDNTQRFTRKTIVGRRCYNRIEALFTYDNDSKLIDTEISGGKLVTVEDYEADQANVNADQPKP
jgi:hypothetical protein